MSDEASGDAMALASALAEIGLPCHVEPRARVALLGASAATTARFAAVATRHQVIALAKAHGFTHVAVELADSRSASGATVLRD
jgi:hypothetical protein